MNLDHRQDANTGTLGSDATDWDTLSPIHVSLFCVSLLFLSLLCFVVSFCLLFDLHLTYLVESPLR